VLSVFILCCDTKRLHSTTQQVRAGDKMTDRSSTGAAEPHKLLMLAAKLRA